MSYIKHKELGLQLRNKRWKLPLDNGDIYSNMYVFKQTLQSNSNVAICVHDVGRLPGGYFDLYAFEAEGAEQQHMESQTEFADFEFVQTLRLPNNSRQGLVVTIPTGDNDKFVPPVVVNRAAATSLGFTPGEAIGKWLRKYAKGQRPAQDSGRGGGL